MSAMRRRLQKARWAAAARPFSANMAATHRLVGIWMVTPKSKRLYYGVPPGQRAVGQPACAPAEHPSTGQLLREDLWQARGRHRIQVQDHPTNTPLSRHLLPHADHASSQI